MAKGYKVNEVIEFRLRCNGDPATDNPTVVIYDELDGVEATLQIGSGLTQVGSTRVVKGTFTPDAQGEWSLIATDDLGLEVTKQYSVGVYNLAAVGAKIATIEAKIDAQDLVTASNHTAVLNALSALGATSVARGGHFG